MIAAHGKLGGGGVDGLRVHKKFPVDTTSSYGERDGKASERVGVFTRGWLAINIVGKI